MVRRFVKIGIQAQAAAYGGGASFKATMEVPATYVDREGRLDVKEINKQLQATACWVIEEVKNV